jgi:hypothetical protein
MTAVLNQPPKTSVPKYHKEKPKTRMCFTHSATQLGKTSIPLLRSQTLANAELQDGCWLEVPGRFHFKIVREHSRVTLLKVLRKIPLQSFIPQPQANKVAVIISTVHKCISRMQGGEVVDESHITRLKRDAQFVFLSKSLDPEECFEFGRGHFRKVG